jgi:aldehyde:ferredoxin oxidoreductase
MNGGYIGKILNVNLTNKAINVEDLSEDIAKLFVGGYGLGARLLYSRMKSGIDPLGAESVLGFVTGPLTGTGAMFGGRFAVVCKSPVNDGWNDANCGGFFGPALKRAGFDVILISGIADHPVYLWIEDGKAEIRDAQHLWGKDCTETEELLKKESGDLKVTSAVIGPSGENCSWMAAIMNDRHRAAGRGGVGAVMGSKKLKAITVHGLQRISVANEAMLREVNRSITNEMKNGDAAGSVIGFGTQGTGMGNVFGVMTGDSPIKNWGGAGTIDYLAENLEVGAWDEKYKFKKYACASCPMGCGAEYDVKDGAYPVGKTQRPEYETVMVFGGLALNEDPEVIFKCNEICNRYGLDTISTGATIAWAIECAENGLLTEEETDGIKLSWGNGSAIVALTEAIAENHGFGHILANGSQAAANKLGKGHEYLQVVRGIELPMHDPKFLPGYARTYQTDPTPARHVKGGLANVQFTWDDEQKYNFSNTGEEDKQVTCIYEYVNITGMCNFLQLTTMLDVPMKLMEAVTGWPIGHEERLAASLRSLNIRHAFNLREGIFPKDSVLPNRLKGIPPLAEGPNEGKQLDTDALAHNFYQAMEWDEVTGKPSKVSLERLGGFDDVIKNFYA